MTHIDTPDDDVCFVEEMLGDPNSPSHKVCPDCKRVLPIEDFSRVASPQRTAAWRRVNGSRTLRMSYISSSCIHCKPNVKKKETPSDLELRLHAEGKNSLHIAYRVEQARAKVNAARSKAVKAYQYDSRYKADIERWLRGIRSESVLMYAAFKEADTMPKDEHRTSLLSAYITYLKGIGSILRRCRSTQTPPPKTLGALMVAHKQEKPRNHEWLDEKYGELTEREKFRLNFRWFGYGKEYSDALISKHKQTNTEPSEGVSEQRGVSWNSSRNAYAVIIMDNTKCKRVCHGYFRIKAEAEAKAREVYENMYKDVE